MRSNHLFLLVNPGSGGKRGSTLLEKVPKPFAVQTETGHEVLLHSYNLAEGPSGDKPAFHALRRMVSAHGITRVIVAGGDGTIKWAVEEAMRHGLDPELQLLIGVLPLGTGNDFSRALGWGGTVPSKLFSKRCRRLADYVRRWLAASAQLHDTWLVRLEVDEECGEMHYVGGDRQPVTKGTHVTCETMINYFSMGLDGRSGYGFDKNRSSSQLCNMCVYIWEGFKKSLPCRAQQRIDDFLSGLYHGASTDGKVIFHTSGEFEAPRPVKDAQLLVVQNIKSYGGGTARLWQGASRLGVDRPLDPNLLSVADDPGDGKLEVVTVRNLPTMVLDPVAQKVTNFGARRVFSGAPLFFEFLEDEEDDVIAFCQVDGEYMKLVNPVSATITWQYRLRVLYNCDDSDYEDDVSGGDLSETDVSETEEESVEPEANGTSDLPERSPLMGKEGHA